MNAPDFHPIANFKQAVAEHEAAIRTEFPIPMPGSFMQVPKRGRTWEEPDDEEDYDDDFDPEDNVVERDSDGWRV